MKLLFFLVAGLLLISSCKPGKSGEEKYCESATAQKLYDPLRPGVCQETYRKLAEADRACLDKCIAKTPDAIACDGLCNLGNPERNLHHTPPASAASP